MKTKHAKRKAAKRAEAKRTRSAKRDAEATREHLRKQMRHDIEYQIKSIRQRNAACSESVAFVNKVYARVRQAISE